MNQFVGMEKCGKCNLEVAKTYICEHTHMITNSVLNVINNYIGL